MHERTLFDTLEIPAREKYAAFKRTNPWLLPKLERRSLELFACGRRHYGMQSLVEGLRYEYARINDPNSNFKINNDYCAYMAREIMNNNPALAGFFKLRQSSADLGE